MNDLQQEAAMHGKALVATVEEEKQLTEFALTLGAPVPKDQRKPVPETEEYNTALMRVQDNITQETSLNGFEVPDGEDLVMLLLHPRKMEDGTAGEPDRIVCAVDGKDFREWVKPALKVGLTHGKVVAADGETELQGFTINCVAHEDGKPSGVRQKMAFAFTDVAALIPFRDVAESTLRAEQRRQDARKASDRRKAVAASRKKLAAASRRRNRK